MSAETLTLYRTYSRAQIHDIFEPDTRFIPQRGTWGLHGIVRIPDRTGDFVLIVTFGKSQGEHQFDEGISTEGILRWQSQPRQGFDDTTVQQLINHDEDRNSIYLFLRTASRFKGVVPDYTYLGRLKYAEHDKQRQKPVHVAWELMNWPIPDVALSRMSLALELEGGESTTVVGLSNEATPERARPGELLRYAPPSQGSNRGESTRGFRASKRRRKSEEENRALGVRGELLVLAHEKRELVAAGRPDLAEKIVHTAVVEGDGAGFDIASYQQDGRPKYIEVKTTAGPKEADFFVSANEVAFAEAHSENYELYRLFDYDLSSNSAAFYVISGVQFTSLLLTPSQFRVGAWKSD